MPKQTFRMPDPRGKVEGLPSRSLTASLPMKKGWKTFAFPIGALR